MGLQETTDIIITFFQNIILLLNIPNVNIRWPREMEEVMNYIKAFVDFDLLQTIASLASARAKELDVHIMLILKNSILPLIVSVLVIVPLKRWYYVTWWIIAMALALAFACCTAAMSFFAQVPFSVDWVTSLHYQQHMYRLTYVPGVPLKKDEYSVATTDTKFSPLLVGLLSGGVALTLVLFFATISIGIILWFLQFLLRRRRFNKALNQMKAKAPPGKKVNVSKLRYRMVYEQVRAKQAEELDLRLRVYWTRIAPLFLILLVEVIVVAFLVFLKDYLDNESPTAAINNWFVYVLYGLIIAAIFAVTCCLIGCNSLVLFERMRKIIFFFNNFVTSKALKVTFLVLSSFYIPLAVSIFSMFDCAQVTCPVGEVFTNRKDDIRGSGYFSRLLEQLIRSPSICTSCQFNGGATNFTSYGGSNATMCPESVLNTLCPGGAQPRLLRQPSISCQEIYPYVAASGALCCLFVITTPFLIFYLIKIATKQLGSVEIPHLLKYVARKKRRAFKNKLEKTRKTEVDPKDLPGLEAFLNHQVGKNLQKTKPRNIIKRIFWNNPVKDLSWEIRIALVDCSVESLYFPFKFRWRYFKLVFLVAKVLLSFVNVFGVTLFGTQPQDNAVGPQLVLWATFLVQLFLGALTVVIRPHMILAETILMTVASLSICANCLFGLVIIYTDVDMPGFVAIAFMAFNSIVLGVSAVASIIFYIYRVRKNNFKTIQKRMKRLLKARVKRAESKGKKAKNNENSKEQIDRYWAGLGRKKREPYLDLDMTKNAGKVLKEIKSAQKYQSAVAYSLNRTSLDTLINFFFFLSIVTSISGVLLATHYVLLFLNPSYVDPYLKMPLEVFGAPLHVEQNGGGLKMSTVSEWCLDNLDTTPGRALLRNETETALENDFHFGAFPSSMCRAGYNLTFAGYDNWEEFTDNCCCTADKDFEEVEAERALRGEWSYKNVEVEIWRCRNGLIKRRIRKMDIMFSAVVSPTFVVGDMNFVSNFISLNGYAMRGFCETKFNSNFVLPHSKTRDCADKEDIASYDGIAHETVRELWYEPMSIRAQYTTATEDRLFEKTTFLAEVGVQNREFYGILWDSVKSVIARTLLF